MSNGKVVSLTALPCHFGGERILFEYPRCHWRQGRFDRFVDQYTSALSERSYSSSASSESAYLRHRMPRPTLIGPQYEDIVLHL
jgi:hypothetical protein